jgi:dolichol kinase
MDSADSLNLKKETIRKCIHLGCTLLPVLYYFYLSREQIILLSSIISIWFIISEFLRYRYQSIGNLFFRTFGPLLREREKKQAITGASYLFITVTVTFILFEKNIAIPSILVLTVSDSFAAIVGKTTDSPKFFSKSVAGSLTFFLVTLIILLAFYGDELVLTVTVAAFLTLIEALPLKINDNILIPLTTGITLYLFI